MARPAVQKVKKIDLGSLQNDYDEAVINANQALEAKIETDSAYLDAIIARNEAILALNKATIEVTQAWPHPGMI